jgi:hypothetical protein
MTRIPNNHEHIEAHNIDQYVREVMRENGIKQAHKLQSVEIMPDASLLVRVEIHPVLPVNLPVMVVNIKTTWEGDESH